MGCRVERSHLLELRELSVPGPEECPYGKPQKHSHDFKADPGKQTNMTKVHAF